MAHDSDDPAERTPGLQNQPENRPCPSGPAAFFNSAYEQFETAAATAGGSIDRYYVIGGCQIRLRFAGAALLPTIIPALAHLLHEGVNEPGYIAGPQPPILGAKNPGSNSADLVSPVLAAPPTPQPALTVCLWDSASTGVAMPHPGWKIDVYRERGEVRGYNEPPIHTVFQVGPNILSLLNSEQNRAIYWVQSVEQIPFYERGAPLRIILELWMAHRGLYFVHAGAVGTSRGGALIVGKGGSGKSTTALSCLGSRLRYAGDDYCLVSAVNDGAQVYSIYSTGKKDADDIERLPFLTADIANKNCLETEKALYLLSERFRDDLITQFPLKAVLIPRITGMDKTTVERVSPARGLAAMAPSSIFQSPGAGHEALSAMGKIVRKTPCFYFNLGRNLSETPEVIETLLRGLE